MSELQATIEIQVELGKFYNVDLFQRGYYQIRTCLKTPLKPPTKVEVTLPRNSDCNLVFPASIINGAAVSKTFQILYRNEDVPVSDVIFFKVHALVESQRLQETLDNLDLQLQLELWFTDEEFGPEQQEKLQCISQRTLKLHFQTVRGIHHHVPVLFDYFHLATICVTIHASLIAIHQPYMNMIKQEPKTGWPSRLLPTATLESVLFGACPEAATNRYALSSRLSKACQAYKSICLTLLSVYESLQTSYEALLAKLPPNEQIKIEHLDCHSKLQSLMENIQLQENEEDLLQQATSDVAQLCAQNVIIWSQYLEMVTLNDNVSFLLAKEHHTQRVKRFAEGFFTYEFPKQALVACYDPSIHGHVDLCTMVRSSTYFQGLLPLSVEAWDLDGDHTTLPVIFEDLYCEAPVGKKLTTTADTTRKSDSLPRRGSEDGPSGRPHRASDSSSLHSSNDSTSPRSRRNKLKFIRNIKPDTFKRPSSFMVNEVGPNAVGATVAIDRTECTLVGYRKMTSSTSAPTVQLGTLTVAEHLAMSQLTEEQREEMVAAAADNSSGSLTVALSMPSLPSSESQRPLVTSGSLPELRSPIPPPAVYNPPSQHPEEEEAAAEGEEEDTSEAGPVRPELLNGLTISEANGSCSSSEGPSEANVLENGYASGTSDNSPSSHVPQLTTEPAAEGIDYDALADTLTRALGEPEEEAKKGEEGNEDSVAAEGEQTSGNGKDASESLASESGVGDSSSAAPDSEATESERTTSSPPAAEERTLASSASGVSGSLDSGFKDGTISISDSLSVIAGGGSVNDHPSSENGSTLGAPIPLPPGPMELPKRLSLDSSDSDLSRECTVLEMLRDEFDKSHLSRKKSDASSLPGGSQISLRDVQLGDPPATSSPALPRRANKTKNKPYHSLAPLGDLKQFEKEQKLVSPVGDSTINFITAKENLRKHLKYNGHLYSDFPTQASTIPYFWPPESLPSNSDNGIHLIVCVHGLDGNSADLRLVRTYLEMALPGARMDFLMSERNQPDTFADFEQMTDRLVAEIMYHMEMYGLEPSRISFIGHSLGNLIIRSCLSRPEMTRLLPKLYTFLSLSGPHLGTLYNSSGLVNMGMWFIQKWKKSGSLLQLSMKDHTDPRQTFLYKLSQKTGMEFFKNILLVGSNQDRYVPFHSTRIELCRAALKDTSGMGAVYSEMVSNILQPIVFKSDINFVRYDVFHALPNTANSLIGRAAHIAVLDSELFIEKFITVSALKYFK